MVGPASVGGEAIDGKATTRRVRGSAPLQISAFGVLGASTEKEGRSATPPASSGDPQENHVKANSSLARVARRRFLRPEGPGSTLGRFRGFGLLPDYLSRGY